MSVDSTATRSKESVEHATPHEIVAMAREVLGSIDCDPCSSVYWNDHVVGARDFYTEEISSLGARGGWTSPTDNTPYYSTFMINPPGGLVKEFWSFARARYLEGSAVFWVGFNLGQLAYLQRDGAMWKGFRRVILPRRLCFLRKVEGGPPVPGMAPTQNNYLLLMPSKYEQVERFEAACARLSAEVF